MVETGIVPALAGTVLQDAEGVRVGAVEDLLADATTNRPAWLVVRTAAGRRTVVPARACRPVLGGMRSAASAAQIEACPVTLGGPSLGREHVVRACRHFGMPLPPGSWAGGFVPVRGCREAPAPVRAAA